MFGLHAGGRAQIENRIAARPERRTLIGCRKEPLPVNRRSRPDASFEQNHETRQVLILCAETIQYPRAKTWPADTRPAIVDQKLRLRMRESLVITGADHRQIIGTLRGVRKKIRYFETRLAVLLEGSLRSQDHQILELAVLKILIPET